MPSARQATEFQHALADTSVCGQVEEQPSIIAFVDAYAGASAAGLVSVTSHNGTNAMHGPVEPPHVEHMVAQPNSDLGSDHE